MNPRAAISHAYSRLRGRDYLGWRLRYGQACARGIAEDQNLRGLADLLRHCARNVPLYAPYLTGVDVQAHPLDALAALPVLTKETLRLRADELKSSDIASRNTFVNCSGGSTGEPVKVVQDREYLDRKTAMTLLYESLIGREFGESEVLLWGSERDLFHGSVGWKAKLFGFLSNTTCLNAFRMTPERMREFIAEINHRRPKLILAYAQAIFELARFAEREGLRVASQNAIMSAAGTLHPFMRETIQRVFGCPVYNSYGCREVGDIACEIPGQSGLWVAPWGTYVEIVDDAGSQVPDGVEGDILVTSLINYAMPLVRYRIGDRGVALQGRGKRFPGQRLAHVSGRVTDNFRTRSGKIVPGEYFIHLLGVVLNDGLIDKFQAVQEDYTRVRVKLVRAQGTGDLDIDEIVAKIRLVMDGDCDVVFEELADIPSSPSGKYRYTVSLVDEGAGHVPPQRRNDHE